MKRYRSSGPDNDDTIDGPLEHTEAIRTNERSPTDDPDAGTDDPTLVSGTRRSVLKSTAALWALPVTAGVVAGSIDSWRVTGPDGELTAVVTQSGDGTQLELSVKRNGRTVLGSSPLGITTDDVSFVTGLSFVSRTDRSVRQEYQTTTGKRLEHEHRAEESTLTFETDSGERVELDIRVAEEGAAYRYRLPGSGSVTVTSEASGFRVPEDATGWVQEHNVTYESLFHETTPAATDGEYVADCIFEVGEDWILLAEANVSGRYAATHLRTTAGDPVFDVVFPDDSETPSANRPDEPSESLRSSETVTAEQPLETPWRTVIVGDLGDVVESDLIQSLSRPAKFDDTSWINPGKAAWSWWSEDLVTSYENQKRYVDYAAEHDWQYYLVDAGWEESWMPDLVEYANERGVEIVLWRRWNGGNVIDSIDEPGLDEPASRERLLSTWKEWGVAGIKVDFLDSDSQERMAFIENLLEATAEKELMVNFHGVTAPRGGRRTWPHEMTREAIKGAEYYKFGELTVEHNVSALFTRNVLGAMDYTPTTFSASQVGDQTTPGHELALSVVYESGWQHLADNVDVYEQWPRAERFMDALETTWDETTFLDGRPGEEATIARRNGQRWFVGSIIAGDGRTVDVPLDFLDNNRPHIAEVTKDAPDENALAIEHHEVRRGETVGIDVPANGGFAIRLVSPPKIDPTLSVAPDELTVTDDEPAALDATVTNHAQRTRTHIDLSLETPDGLSVESSENTSVKRLRSGESATATWTVKATDDLLPGRTEGVVTASIGEGKGNSSRSDYHVYFTHPLDPLPEGWETFASTEARFGSVDQHDTLAIWANGTDVWVVDDEYGTLYPTNDRLPSHGSATVEVVSQEDTGKYAKAGLMAANDITAAGESAPDVIVFVTPSDGFHMEWDSDGDGYIDSVAAADTTTYPCKVKLEKEGTTFTGSYSTDDGKSWTVLETVDLPDADPEQDVGMFATSHTTSDLGLCEFDKFEILDQS